MFFSSAYEEEDTLGEFVAEVKTVFKDELDAQVKKRTEDAKMNKIVEDAAEASKEVDEDEEDDDEDEDTKKVGFRAFFLQNSNRLQFSLF